MVWRLKFAGLPAVAVALALALELMFLAGCQTGPVDSGTRKPFSHFIGITDFKDFTRTVRGDGQVVLVSPEITAPMEWDQLVVSWNVSAPPGTFLEVAAAARSPRRTTTFYSLGRWTPDDKLFPRASVSGQQDGDGRVDVDTLVLKHLADAAQIRLTLGGTNGALPTPKFLGLSFCNSRAVPETLPSNHAAWGKVLPVVERSQQSYAGGNGWCSPTSLSMALSYWGNESNRADWKLDAPEVAAGVIDHHFKKATGNWAFNTAYAGSLDGMRAYVTRFNDISELEEWIAAGVPVVISARYDLLQDGRKPDYNGHLTVCRGFTRNGDVVINDPWTDLKVESVRHVYKRENVRRAWATSHNTVYLVYPETVKPPPDRLGQWW
ncbi:MAG TPA: peptidase C39 family protein [Verrucomicrobiae bacterium]|nr:peptidase C39 family protein [Verrucomicrobiae bacterium]